jgi:hypothetical protein
MKPRRFKGELAKPILIRTRSVTLLTDTPEDHAEIKKHNSGEFLRALGEQLDKIELLRKEFKLQDSKDPIVNFVTLTLALASEYVPGFRIKNLVTERGKGRQTEWNVMKYCQLLADIQTLLNEKTRSVSEACQILVTNTRYTKRWGKYSKRTLENRLVMANDEEKNVMMKLGRRVDSEGRMDEVEFKNIIMEHFAITKNSN